MWIKPIFSIFEDGEKHSRVGQLYSDKRDFDQRVEKLCVKKDGPLWAKSVLRIFLWSYTLLNNSPSDVVSFTLVNFSVLKFHHRRLALLFWMFCYRMKTSVSDGKTFKRLSDTKNF